MSSSSSVLACVISGFSRGIKVVDPRRPPKNDRRPLWPASIDVESGSGRCCNAKDEWHIERMIQIMNFTIV